MRDAAVTHARAGSRCSRLRVVVRARLRKEGGGAPCIMHLGACNAMMVTQVELRHVVQQLGPGTEAHCTRRRPGTGAPPAAVKRSTRSSYTYVLLTVQVRQPLLR
jgi:hypothetical protein